MAIFIEGSVEPIEDTGGTSAGKIKLVLVVLALLLLLGIFLTLKN